MNQIRRFFFRGLLALLPISLTIYLLFWVFAGAERLVNRFIFWVFPNMPYLPGMGLFFAIIVVTAFGFLMSNLFVQRFYGFLENLLNRIPLMKSIYGAVKDFTEYFSKSKSEGQQVVMVQYPGTEVRLIGFMTRSHLDQMPEPMNAEGRVAIYLPLSYQIGGLTVFIPKEWVTPLNLSVESAMRQALTAWMPPGKAKVSDEKYQSGYGPNS